jgi:hypothetical protein
MWDILQVLTQKPLIISEIWRSKNDQHSMLRVYWNIVIPVYERVIRVSCFFFFFLSFLFVLFVCLFFLTLGNEEWFSPLL